MATTWTTGGSNANRGATGVSSMAGTMKYGSLDETEAFKIQKKIPVNSETIHDNGSVCTEGNEGSEGGVGG